MCFKLSLIAIHKFILKSWHLRSNAMIVNLKSYLTKVKKITKQQYKIVVQVDSIDAEDIIKDVSLRRDLFSLFIKEKLQKILTM